MFGSDILDIAIGMVFIFLLLSLLCSALNEFLESLMKNRAKDLERGIAELVGDPANTSGIIDLIYNHGMVNSLFKGPYPPESKGDLPSYIPAQNFALAIMDLANNPPAGMQIPPNLQTVVTMFQEKAAGNAVKLQANLEDWFNTGMDRVSGWYKRRSQWIILALGAILAIGINADSLRLAQTLSNDSVLRKGLVAAAEARANHPEADPDAAQVQIQHDLASINSLGLPIGWNISSFAQLARPEPAADEGGFGRALQWSEFYAGVFLLTLLQHLPGWILTAFAISMGAPFWFDLLGKIITVRSTLKPQTDDSKSS